MEVLGQSAISPKLNVYLDGVGQLATRGYNTARSGSDEVRTDSCEDAIN